MIERAQLHQQIGDVLEEYFSGVPEEIAVQLAYHFRLAGIMQKAIHYFQLAGQQAIRLSSFEDAIVHFNTALSLLRSQPKTIDRNVQELDLLMSLSMPLMVGRGYASPDLGVACNRIRQILNEIPLKPEMFPIIHALSAYYATRADYQKSLAVIRKGVRLAKSSGDDLLIHIIGWEQGFVSMGLGELNKAVLHLEKMAGYYDPHEHHGLRDIYGTDPGVGSLTWCSWILWMLGYSEKALARSREAIELGQLLGDPDLQLFSQTLAAFLHLLLREPEDARDLIESCSSLLEQHPLPLYSADLEFLKGLYRLQNGDPEAGIASMALSMENYQAIGTRFLLSMRFTLEAEAYFRSNQLEQASQLLRQAEDFIEETGERFYQAETLRMKGETILRQTPNRMEEAEACFSQALQAARRQKAKTLELRAAMSLARLWQSQGRLSDAYKVLSDVYKTGLAKDSILLT